MILRFEQLHPFTTFLYYAGAIAIIMLMLHPYYLCVILFTLLLREFVYDRFRGLRGWFIFIFLTALIIVLVNPFFNQRGLHVLWEFGDRRFTLEAFLYGGITALSLIGIVTLFISFNRVMTPNKLLFLFARILPQFALLLMLTLRFIPLMKRRLDDIASVQQSKGISITSGKWNEKAKKGLLYVQVLLTYSLEEAIQTADSMKARGYGTGKRSSYDHFSWYRSDYFVAALIIGCLLILFYGRFNGYGYLTIYPVMDSLQLVGADWFLLSFIVVYFLFPLWLEWGGMLKWRILN
ncbi:energy-coupling factor transporter transmembrane component T [Bacillus sp. JCM 19034]|uniref:energy-coupling factor transporter transmembrane component T n=1 Tax=Bacillus sp. JCM 19034 TaxID=1481928 RepID=UPI000785987D|nr:energy-coupling factor transporter transmembrane component T [Bacillus sp. JCM 19034]